MNETLQRKLLARNSIVTRLTRLNLGLGLLADETVEGTAGRQPLDASAVRDEAAGGLPLEVVLTRELGEAPVGRNVDLLATGELELRVAKRVLGDGLVLVEGTDGHEAGADVHTGGNLIQKQDFG